MGNVAIFGGAFDPPTLGHIEVARLVLGQIDEVWLMPCYRHSYDKEMASPEDRLTMCRIAAHYDKIKVSDYEIKLRHAAGTYHLMKTMLEDPAFDNCRFSYIIGQDNANSFDKWLNFEKLKQLLPFIVVPRHGVKPDFSKPWFLKPPHIFLDGEAPLEISSSFIRQQVSAGVVPEGIDRGVYDCIMRKGLYLAK